MPPIYLDYNATTPLDSQVRQAMLPFLNEVFGNPSSIHHFGRQARASLDDARERVSQVWQCKPSEVVFTSGGTESINLALFGCARLLGHRGRHMITSSIEHPAVLQSLEYLEKREGYQVTRLPVTAEGVVDPATLAAAIRSDTILVSLMAANNEIGTIQPVAELGGICREKNVLFHTDAVQWFGKEPFTDIHQFQADLVSMCAHKFHGPKGVGALFVRSPLQPDPILFGGGHENERRAGTENLPAIIGLTKAMELFLHNPVFPQEQLEPLTQRLLTLLDHLKDQGVIFRGSRHHRLSNTIAFTVRGCDSVSLLVSLDLEGICVSSGSACSTGSIGPSHVLQALGVEEEPPQGFIRISLGRDSTGEEIRAVEQVLPTVIRRAQQAKNVSNYP